MFRGFRLNRAGFACAGRRRPLIASPLLQAASDVAGDFRTGERRAGNETDERPEAQRRDRSDEVQTGHRRLEMSRQLGDALDAANLRYERSAEEREPIEIRF